MGTLFHDGFPVYQDPRLVSTRDRGVAPDQAPNPRADVDPGSQLKAQ
jgi:hypothetical protein